MRRLVALLALTLAACGAETPAPDLPVASRAVSPETALPPMRSFVAGHMGRPTRPNAQMAQDFLDLAFRMESGRALPVMTRFDGPVRVRVAGPVPPTLGPDLDALIARLRAEAGIDVSRTDAPDAEITVQAVPRAELRSAVPGAACFVVPGVSSWPGYRAARGSAAVDWAALQRRQRAAIFIPAEVAPQEIRDCLNEELAQAMGPIDDLYRLPDSIFNDDNVNGPLTGFDMLMLRLYTSPELANGMTRAQAAAIVPGLLARLNPAGEVAGPPEGPDPSRAWISAVQDALLPANSAATRRSAAARAWAMARDGGYGAAPLGFSAYVYGRLMLQADEGAAAAAFAAADRAYRSSPQTRQHVAVVAVQLAALALSRHDETGVLRITDEAMPLATAAQNAAVLASLMMIRAAALERAGRGQEAAAVRMDSLGWARYGFGAQANVRARLREIAAIAAD
ncbi:MAG: DUF2927 domain-containing protein [Limimaricola sp.]|uniref:DUF2927 domain-containing protein n=1 Tax=Limimaricola sp. TaxID=2211665 RepID=UPI001D7D0D94|nr:DUF2927 domain-containing protein [Limimaricola sp.]MBI1418332.1 DUF2927 domain-containing protein [Limimaricola sp.]